MDSGVQMTVGCTINRKNMKRTGKSVQNIIKILPE
jgi:hypothetical protein